MLAYHGLRPAMKAEVRQELDEKKLEQVPPKQLFALARRAEVRGYRDEMRTTHECDNSNETFSRQSLEGEIKYLQGEILLIKSTKD